MISAKRYCSKFALGQELLISTANEHNARKSSDVRLVWISRTPHDAEFSDKWKCVDIILLSLPTQKFISLLLWHFAEIFFFSSIYCLKEDDNEHHQPKNLRNQSEKLLEKIISLFPQSFLPCLVDAVWVTGSSDFSVHSESLLFPHICHAPISSVNPTLGD